MGQVSLEHVGDELGSLLDVSHLLLEVVLGLFGYLLIRSKIIIGITLSLGLFAIERLAKPLKEHIHRRAVADQMMHIDQQIKPVGFDDLEPDAGSLFEIERANKFLFIRFKLGVGHLHDRYVDNTVLDGLLDDLVIAVGNKVTKDIVVSVCHLADGAPELLFGYAVGHSQDEGQIVSYGLRISLTLGIYALLGKAQAAGLGARSLLFGCGSLDGGAVFIT